MLLRIIVLLYLFSFLLSADASALRPTYVMVFHENYCKNYNSAIQHYMDSLELNGYSAFHFCTDTVDINELKKRINHNTEKRKVSLSEIKGINIFGPITSTKVIDYLKPYGLSFYPTTTLAADNIELVLRKNTVIDIKTEKYKSPVIKRWVSHIFASPSEINTDISTALYAFSDKLARHGVISAGEIFKNNLQNNFSNYRTIEYYSFPRGEGTAIIGMTSFPVLWTISGLARMREGYGFWKRYQTFGDYFGSSLLIGLMLGLEAYSIKSYLYTQYYLPDDNRWKKVLLTKSLAIDGFLDTYAEQHNHFHY
ncbi:MULTISPECIES: hypothetical protein [unclassified Endozoicomonas]|uniref:hypothetical protein n=1 Tax=unclassified Endozoicomonas TaxID=2644528 RepID=UPI003BB04151